ncbi:MAG TPA: TonB-dependent receptor [Candidatus Angelobacter sp.]|nr:TonB-dependent receptor [Candidatus Angelobacter sp.]
MSMLSRLRYRHTMQDILFAPGRWFVLLCLMAVFSAGGPMLQAQTNTAAVRVIVKDVTGAVVPGASVVVVEERLGLSVSKSADATGAAFVAALPAGEYSISAEAKGFRKTTQKSVVLTIGQEISLELTVKVGSSVDEVVVESILPLLQTATAEVSDTIRNQKIVDLPLNGRQFLQLAQLSDGVVKPPGGTRGAALEQAGDLVGVLGQRSGHNIYFLDGVPVTDEYFNNLAVSPSIDAIQEFEIQKGIYSAEFGGKAGALINVATKSGTNQYHGSAFEFLRNNALDAKNFFDDPTKGTPPLRQNQFGFSFGGPVSIPGVYEGKNKTFFFVSYEGDRSNQSITRTFSVPTLAERSGNFGGVGAIFDPLTTDSSGRRTSFANNVIPAGRLDPAAVAFLANVPLPNRPGNVQNLITALPQVTDLNQWTARIDHHFSEADNLFSRLSVYRVTSAQPFGASELNESLLPGFGRNLSTYTTDLAAGYTHAFSPNVLNEFRFGWLIVAGGQTSQNQGNNFAAQAGLQGVTSDPRDIGFPQVSFAGLFSTAGDPTSFTYRSDRSFDFFDNVLIHHGKHNTRVGVYLFHLSFNPENPDTARGAYSFSNRWTSSQAGLTDGNAFADFLLGFPTSAQVGIGRGQEQGHTNWIHTYVQDDWTVTPNFTLNAGIRYEFNQNIQDGNNQLSSIDVQQKRFIIAANSQGQISPAASALLPLLPLPFVTSAQAGFNPSLLKPEYLRFSPRAGFAWRPLGNSSTVVRAGFGIFQNQAAYSVQQALARNLPFFLTKSVSTSATTAVPTLTTEDILASSGNGTIGGNDVNSNFRSEYNEEWNLSIQHLLGKNASVEASYFGSRTIGADSSTVLNVPTPGPGSISARRPIPELSQFNTIRWDGKSYYDALILKGERRFAGGLIFSANYTWSKSIDDASDPGATTFEANLPQDVNDIKAEKALSSFDHRNRFVANVVYPISFFRSSHGFAGAMLRGWQVSGITILQSGAPFTVNLGTDQANIGPGPAQRPNLLHDPNLSSGQSVARWFDTSAFALPSAFTFGNAGRNIVQAPGFADFDLALQKEVALRDGLRLTLRSEFFNALNHPNFDVPNRIAFTPNFGRIFSAESPRQIQLAAKLNF